MTLCLQDVTHFCASFADKMLAHFNKEDMLKMATKAKMASHLPLKVVVTPTTSEDDEDTASGFIFTRKRGKARAASPMPFPISGSGGFKRGPSSTTLYRPSHHTGSS